MAHSIDDGFANYGHACASKYHFYFTFRCLLGPVILTVVRLNGVVNDGGDIKIQGFKPL